MSDLPSEGRYTSTFATCQQGNVCMFQAVSMAAGGFPDGRSSRPSQESMSNRASRKLFGKAYIEESIQSILNPSISRHPLQYLVTHFTDWKSIQKSSQFSKVFSSARRSCVTTGSGDTECGALGFSQGPSMADVASALQVRRTMDGVRVWRKIYPKWYGIALGLQVGPAV